jgi:hypothetical protein
VRSQTFLIPAPDKWINANNRLHWRKKAALTATWREAAGWIGKADRPVQFERAHAEVYLFFRTAHLRDAGNYAPTVKAAIDGLVCDAGVLPNDDDAHMLGPDIRPGKRVGPLADVVPAGFTGMVVVFTALPAVADGAA